jgi:serine/threonine-protein kinase
MVHADTDRNLLYGLLALQIGLVDQDQLLAAFRAWSRDSTRPLAEHLAGHGDLDAEQRALIEGLVAQHLKKHGGSLERSLAGLAVGRSTRESLARAGGPAIEATLTHLGPVPGSNGIADLGTEVDPDCTASYSLGSATSDGQRFRVLRPHARGGLGTVFVALDTELHREVALKQILDSHADDPISRQRFLMEAEITGNLEHPGIVPVYGLGTDEAGRPYYAMRFIRGDSLRKALDAFHADAALQNDPGRRSLELRQLLHRFTDVCNAIEYAHARGVLHRDIKPSNVILGKHGETLVVDWGLAKPVGRAESGLDADERTLRPCSASGSAETLPGSALGTPAYMSPEQAEGRLDRLGPRSDVYSLGATLYCLLSSQPPFAGDAADVIPRVQQGDFRPPRAIDPTLDRALEAVCLKAMALRPEDRYATPKALAEDLERWMADEPVTAWREPRARRARRWARRNRTAVTGAAATLLAGVVGLATVLAVQARANVQLRNALGREARANASLAASNAELTRAKAGLQARYDLAAEAIKTFHTGASEDFFLKEEAFKGFRDRLLGSASDFYVKLGALLGKESDPTSRRALGQANFELANLTANVGRAEDALAAHRRVLAYREALANEPEVDLQTQADVGRSLISVASLLDATGRHDEALATSRQAERLLAELVQSQQAAAQAARVALAACRSQIGWLLSGTGHDSEALAMLRLARVDQEALAGGERATAESQHNLANTILTLGGVLKATGRPVEALAEYRTALAILQQLVADHPDVTSFRHALAWSHLRTGELWWSAGNLTEALASSRRALVIFGKLSADHPAVTGFRYSLGSTHCNLGSLLWQFGKMPEALAEFRAALAILETMVEQSPTAVSPRETLANTRTNLGILLAKTGRPAEALGPLQAAVTDHEKLVKQSPSFTFYRDALANELATLADILLTLRRTREARAACERAIALRESVIQAEPRNDGSRAGLADSLCCLGRVRRAEGDAAGAAADWRRAIAIFEGLPPQPVESRVIEACCHAGLAGVAGAPGPGLSAADGLAEAEKAMALLRQAVAMGSRHLDWFRNEAGLDPLRDRADFQELMMDLALPDEPFAPGD